MSKQPGEPDIDSGDTTRTLNSKGEKIKRLFISFIKVFRICCPKKRAN